MVKRAPARRRPRKAKPGTKGLSPAECQLQQPAGAAAEAAHAVEKAGGCVVGLYKDPLAGHPILLAILPIDAIEPTPFQRDLSDAHYKRLADVINKTGRFLDPVIAIVAKERLLDPQWPASAGGDAPAWREVDLGSRGR
jgi:ParB family chromosome partitioning protein